MRIRSLIVVVMLGFAVHPASAQLLSPNLLYNAIQPCRIVDTRGGGGILNPGNAGARTINVVGVTDYSSQGGFAGDCHIPGWSTSGTPVPRVQAIVVNLVAVGAAGAGDLKAWPTDQAQPNASVLNFAQQGAVGGLNIANGVVLAVRQDLQGNDVTIKAESSATHVVADVVGYFSSETDANAGNLFLGMNAGKITSLNGGTLNVGLGDQVMVANTSGCHDVAVGRSAMASNTGGSYEVAVGFNVMAAHVSGDYNTAVGAEALQSSTSGSQNTALGWTALSSTTTGTGNIAIGAGAGTANARGASNNIDIGSNGGASDSGVIRLGAAGSQVAAYIAGINGATSSSGTQVFVNGAGLLGTSTSSIRFKQDVKDMGATTGVLMKLRPVTFHYRPEVDDGSDLLQYGLIAEEVAQVSPGLVQYDPAGAPLAVRYHFINAMLLNEVQQLHRQLANEESRGARQADELTELRAEIARLQQQVGALAARLQP